MTRWRFPTIVSVLLLGLFALGRTAAGGEPAADFENQIAPLLVRNCVNCHNSSELKGGLDLTSLEAALAGGDSGPVFVPGQSEASPLIDRVVEGTMPPEGQGDRLAPEQIALLREWIAAGAVWPEGRVLSAFEFTTNRRAGYDWWSLRPVERPAPPEVRNTAWPRTPIDRFILSRLEQAGRSPAPEVDRVAFLRRARLDLLGLPPTPEEIDAFLADDAPNAVERLIDRLLASPHYGERWGRHWLDVARYGESDGFENDKLRDHAWRYRDWVIDSFNRDLPYDQFVVAQLAGDVAELVTRDGIVATGFLVAGSWDEVQNVGKSQAERQRTHEEQIEELIAAVSQSFLGMTVNCARCHDHKFDPIPQADYYRLKAVFDGVDHGNRPLLTPEEQREYDQAVAPLNERIALAQSRLDELKAETTGEVSENIPADALVAGRFDEALDARKAQVGAARKPEYSRPPFTVECWAKVDSRGGFNVLAAHLPKESADHWEIYTYAGSGEFSLYLPGYAPAEIKSGVDITGGDWRHVAASFDGQTARLYVDGRLAREQSVTRAREGGPSGPLWFGSYPPGSIGCDGLIDEVRFSNVVRAIDAAPDAPLVADEHTIGLWRFDRADGERLRNQVEGEQSGELGAGSAERKKEEADRAQVETLTAELKELEARRAALAPALTYSGVRKQPDAVHVLLRGDISQPADEVAPAALTAVNSPDASLELGADAPEAQRRLRFARWVVDPANPLTARVLVNRVWQQHFGQGLVETPSDFGFNGGQPTHPELLDWLASEFVASGWSIKQLHRTIMSSAVYRQSARFDADAAAADADNRLLWRFPPRRLEAEIVRDAMLAVSGELNPQVGGPSFRPFTVTSLLTQFYHPIDPGTPDHNRRTVYRMNVNTGKSAFLDALDCPAPSLASPHRRNTTTALQSLALMNDSFVLRPTASRPASGRPPETTRPRKSTWPSGWRLAARQATRNRRNRPRWPWNMAWSRCAGCY
jgi:mono/diheme cytochrome c family protein